MYKIAVCDDDKNYIEFLKKQIAGAGVVTAEDIQFYDFFSGEEFYVCQALYYCVPCKEPREIKGEINENFLMKYYPQRENK